MNSDYYPAGAAGDPSAPYNERELPPRDFDCEVSVTLSKVMPVATTDYWVTWEDADGIEAEPDHADWEADYIDDDRYMGPLGLLQELEKYIEGEMQGHVSPRRMRRLRLMLDECRGWQLDNTEVEQA